MAKLISTNSANNYKVLGKVKISSDIEIQDKVSQANEVKKNWKELGIKKRITYLKSLYNAFESEKEKIAYLITKETGKPISQTRAELRFFQLYNKWNLENAAKILEDETTYEDKKTKHIIIYEPIGVASIILPWNSPFGLFSWKVFANLIVGNTVLVKHSEECPLTAKLIEEIVNKCNLPEGVFNMIYGDSNVGKLLVNKNIDLIVFSGSSEVGKELYETAAKKFIKAIMELGGSNPSIIFSDADLTKVTSRVFYGRFANCGQNCDAIKRLIVHKDIVDKINASLTKELEMKKIGDPNDEATYFGTLVSEKQLQTASEQLNDALDKGAKIVAQLKVPKNLKGSFFSPIILSNISKNMKVWNEEVFAPILPIITFETEEEAIELANDTKYGLGATIFTEDKELFNRVANKLNCGNVEHNTISQWIPCNPFGGYKESGIGRENGAIGLKELCQLKVLSIEK